MEVVRSLPGSSDRVPQEICDHILDYLWNDYATLRICSLTTRKWLPTTRFHRFRTVVIFSSSSYTQFMDILDKSPAVGSYIGDLSLGLYENPPHVQRLLDKIGTSLQHLRISPLLNPAESVTLANNTELRSLYIEYIDVDGRHSHLPEDYNWIMAALCHLNSPHLEEIRLGLQFRLPRDLSVLKWSALDEHLTRLARDLPRLVIVFRAYNLVPTYAIPDAAPYAFPHEVVATIVRELPKLGDSGNRWGVICEGRGAAGEKEHWFNTVKTLQT
ncbi:hypothetical protein BKA93DRAFT_796386 [Sparassis latifolia]